MDYLKDTAGNRVKMLIATKGITQTELAIAVNVSKDMISKIITGKTKLGIETGMKIADYFGTSLDFLYGRTHIDNIPLYIRDNICSHITPMIYDVKGNPSPSLLVSKSLADYIGAILDIKQNDKMPDDLRSVWIDRVKQELLDDLQNVSVMDGVVYHLVRGDIPDDEIKKQLESLLN